ncbi:MAG: tRNA threonylcarbamoyladenosine dehydratase [Bacteroidaceae bacterium]|jgi:tRNA A37 threonylcarbamoyladenosine dehydratase|nr:tRNA threonylcarbamoyladenosine dehydratase [Bacteroidaceae bacterium]
MEEWMQRTSLLLSEEKTLSLQAGRVLVVGVGGVGAYAAEMLVRAGVGRMTIIDSDSVAVSNINRQLVALHSTVGQDKVAVLAQRLNDINPHLELSARKCYLDVEGVDALLQEGYDFVVDAIDTVAPKVALLAACMRQGIAVVSSMGAGARIDPSQIRYADIADTFHCGLARAVRTRLRKMGVKGKLPVVFSTEVPRAEAVQEVTGERNKRTTVGTVSYMPAIFGCYLAAYVIRRLTQQ